MYYGPPDKERVGYLDLSGFKVGDGIIYCPNCLFQAKREDCMMSHCPDCKRNYFVKDCRLRLLTLDAEAMRYINEAKFAPHCPKCDSFDVRFDNHSSSAHCLNCGLDDFGINVDWYSQN